MQLYFIRHAQSGNNKIWQETGGVAGRSPDPVITDLGHDQAAHLARFIARPPGDDPVDLPNRSGVGLTHLHCSLMTRAVETARVVARAAGLQLTAHDAVHEFGGIFRYRNGIDEHVGLPGPNRAYFAERFPELRLPDSVGDDGWWRSRTEDRDTLWQRAHAVVADLLARHDDADRVGLVSHGGFYQAFMGAMLEMTEPPATPQQDGRFGFAIANTAVTRFDIYDGRRVLVYANRVDFLPPELVTF